VISEFAGIPQEFIRCSPSVFRLFPLTVRSPQFAICGHGNVEAITLIVFGRAPSDAPIGRSRE